MFDNQRFVRLETIFSAQFVRFLEMARNTDRTGSDEDKSPSKSRRDETERSSVYDQYNGW